MPFDSKDFVETKPDVFSLDGLIAWLETQDPATTYSYADIRGCLLYRALSDAGYPIKGCGGNYWSDKNNRMHALPGDDRAGQERRGWGRRVADGGEWNYGAALERARKLLAES